MKFRVIFALCIIVFCIEVSISSNFVFADPVNRQEIKDSINDWVIREENADYESLLIDNNVIPFQNAKKIQECIPYDNHKITPEISSVSYQSDGKILTTTIWLTSNIEERLVVDPTNFKDSNWHNIGYTVSIDVNSVYESGVDFYHKIFWDAELQTWTELIEEVSFYGQKRTIENKDITDSFQYDKNYLTLELDLEKIGNPTDFSLLATVYDRFVKDDTLCTLLDVGNWVQVPAPEFIISSSDSDIVITPDGETYVEIRIESLTRTKANVELWTGNIRGLEFKFASDTTYVPPNSIGTTVLKIRADENIEPRTYTIPLYANFTFPSIGTFRSSTTVSQEQSTSVIDVSNIIIKVEANPSNYVVFASFWQTYGFFLSSLGIGGGTYGIKHILDKRKYQKKQNNSISEYL